MTSQVSAALRLGSCERIVPRRRQAFNTSALHRCELIPTDFEMDRWRQDREGKWRHHHACGQQNGSGRETVQQTVPTIVSEVICYEPGSNDASGPCKSVLHQWSGFTSPAGKSQLRKESREPKSWTSCSSRPVPRQAAMSNRWSLHFCHILCSDIIDLKCSYYFDLLSKGTHGHYCQFHSICFEDISGNGSVSVSSSPAFVLFCFLRVNALSSV